MTRRRFVLVFVVAAWNATLSGCTRSAISQPPERPAADVVGALMFKVRGPDADHESFLLGTHHAFGGGFIAAIPGLGHAMNHVDTVVTETGTTSGRAAADVINARTSTTPWPRYLDRERRDFVRGLLSASEIDLDKLTPAELSSALFRHYAMTVCEARVSADRGGSFDEVLAAEAEAAGKRVVGLETTEDQLELIRADVEGMPAKVHRRRLRALISMIVGRDAANCGEVVEYRAMRLDYAWSRPCTNALVLTDRNARWLAQIEPMLASGPTLVAVGQGHLKFECGLVEQLRAAGYVVTPVL